MTDDPLRVMASKANELEERIRPVLAGHPPQVQGATLASLLAAWIAGHQAPDEVREQILAMHLDTVRKLVPVYALLISARHGKRRRERRKKP